MASLEPHKGRLGPRLSAHLLRRASFGANRREIDFFAEKSAEEAVEQLLDFPLLPPHPIDPKTSSTWLPAGHNANNSSNEELKLVVNSWYLQQILDPRYPLSAFTKVVFFLHTSFSTSYKDITWNENFYYTIRLLMYYAAGSYKKLAAKICLDNGMNKYLDIGDSKKDNPNENFSREFFELFTIGKGPQIGEGDYTYFTEEDIREASRLLTGFRKNDNWDDPQYWDPEHGMPRAKPTPSRHDTGEKVFSSAFKGRKIEGRITETGMIKEVEELVDMIFDQEQTSITICRRIYRMFVSRQLTEEVENDVISPLAKTLRENDYAIVAVLRQLLKSRHFYNEDLIEENSQPKIIGALVKSPLELMVGMIRYLGLDIPDPAVEPALALLDFYQEGLQKMLTNACLDLFAPPDVAGYEPIFQAPEFQRLWISAKSISARYDIAENLLTGDPLFKVDIMSFVSKKENISDFEGADFDGIPGPHPGIRIAGHLVSELVNHLLAETPLPNRMNYFLQEVLLDTLSEKEWMYEYDAAKASGDMSPIQGQITKLLRSILQSPEYQLA